MRLGGLVGCGEGGGTTRKPAGADLPPPGGRFWTTRFRVPVLAKREAGMTVVIVVELMKVAGNTVCPTRTCEPFRKLEPTMVTVTGLDPIRALAGSIRSTVGAGFRNDGSSG